MFRAQEKIDELRIYIPHLHRSTHFRSLPTVSTIFGCIGKRHIQEFVKLIQNLIKKKKKLKREPRGFESLTRVQPSK